MHQAWRTRDEDREMANLEQALDGARADLDEVLAQVEAEERSAALVGLRPTGKERRRFDAAIRQAEARVAGLRARIAEIDRASAARHAAYEASED